MHTRDRISFDLIPLADIPSKPPIVRLASDPIGSQWDEVLRKLNQERGRKGARIFASDKKERNRLKSTLQTIAKNRCQFVEVRDYDNTSFCVWISEKAGRRSAIPTVRERSPTTGVVVDKPNSQTVQFAGKSINLSAISRDQGIDKSYLSRIFNGQRMPTMPYARKIAASMGMGLEEFLDALQVARGKNLLR
jgi:hypothetical protein